MKSPLFVATHNAHKVREIGEILPDFEIIPDDPEGVVENAEDFVGNALIKVRAIAARHRGAWCLADDSGLEVKALGGAPGVRSARYAGEPSNTPANNALLLKNLSGVKDRSARFICAIALVDPEGVEHTVEGHSPGRIAETPSGAAGFGYDPLFIPDGYDVSFADLSSEAKNAISHRGRALALAARFLSPARGLCLMSGGLDSQLAVRVLERAGAKVEAVAFVTPFFDNSKAEKAAAALGVKLHLLDFLEDEIELIENPPHGFGGAMNPCIDCHARMIRRAGELMTKLGYDFVATGEVRGQRPMSQNAQSLITVEKASGLKGRLVRPLSAKLLEPSIPELNGKLDREQLLDISGRSRDRQIALAAEFGITDYPSPAGGCKLTEAAFGRRLKDLIDHEGVRTLDGKIDRQAIELLKVGRRFRLPGGSCVILGRDAQENHRLKSLNGLVFEPENGVPGPTAYVPELKSATDRELARAIVRAWSRGTTENDRAPYQPYQLK